jgi:glycine cleavage system regulatory protein
MLDTISLPVLIASRVLLSLEICKLFQDHHGNIRQMECRVPGFDGKMLTVAFTKSPGS